jgi:iron-sulfur cluster assembly accessory protein
LVTVTDRAASELKTLLAKEEKTDYLIRIYFAGAGCSGPQFAPALDMKKNEDDITSSSNGINLVFSKDIELELKDYQLDYVETPYGAGFTVKNPNAVCGPGCSGCH